jgi:hypothetical protein
MRACSIPAVSLCVLVVAMPGGAARAASVGPIPEQTLARNLLNLDEAMNALAAPGSDYRNVLLRAWARSEGESRDAVGSDIATFLDRAPRAGLEFRCGADFMRDSARRELRRLKDVLLRVEPWPAEPRVCFSVPVAIDATRPPGAIDVYGQDFDRKPWELFILKNDKFFVDVTPALKTRSRHQLSIDLGPDGVKIPADGQALALAWGHLVRYTIPIIHPLTPLCESSIEEIPAGKTIAYAPFVIGGEKPFRGVGAKVVANLALDYESNKIDAMVCFTAAARSLISGCASEYVHTSDSELTVEAVFGELEAGIAYTHGRRSRRIIEGAANGPVARWVFDGFVPSDNSAAEAGIAVRLRKVRAVTTDPQRCVSAIQYLEAKRQQAITPETARRLDRQLPNVDPRIRKLRPRFAP